jgi:hypothetical protein
LRSPCFPELLLLTLLPTAGLAEEAAPRVAVVVDTAVNLDHAAQVTLAEQVADALRRALVVDVAGGREVDRRLAPMGLPEGCFREAACQRKVAGILEVDELLVLVAVRLGTRLQVEPTWIHVPSGRAVGRDAVVVDTVRESVPEAMAAAAPRLLPDARLRPPPPPPPAQVLVMGPTRTATPTHTASAGPPVATWVAGGVALVALSVGVGVGLSAQGDYQRLEDEGCDKLACDPERISAVDSKALAADLLFGAAAAAALTGALLWWLDAPAGPVQAGVAPSAGGATLQLGGRF